MRNLFYVVLIISATLIFSCKGKQTQTVSSNNEDCNIAEIIKEINAEFAENDSTNGIFELKVTSPQPIDTALLREMLTEDFSNFSTVQQRLINDLLKLDNTSVKALGDAKEVLKKYLKNSTAKQCDSLYVPYHNYTSLILNYIYNDEYYGQVPAGYFSIYDSFEDLPPAYKSIMNELNTYGIQLEDVGEGCADLSFYPDYFYELFKPYTTASTKEYLKLLAFERANKFLFDAAVCISWEELADRTINFEDFLETYPQSMFAGEIEDKYYGYIYFLLMGCDNTPTFDRNGDNARKLNADVFQSYQKIIETYSHRRLAQTLRDYCSVLEKSNMLESEEVDEFIGQYIK